MAIGVRQQFDIAGVILAMGSAGLSPKIKLDNSLAQRMVSDIAVAGMTSVVRGRFDMENLAAQLLTDVASYITHQQFKPISDSDDYHQSKQASRGAGHITQTTVEQQWENQLINDANFTANTQLPSVTFDVNNSYVSQQLGQRVGEEVSHFYHPTPPPRNPNGFWRGVDDVLEMQEGTRKAADLIFTGNYEAPKNRWQKAGYDIGVSLAIGAEFVMAGERLGVGAVEVIENVYQGSQRVFGSVASKLERWGLFGQGSEKNLEALSIFKANNQVTRLKLSSELALKEAGILDLEGKLTTKALQNSFPAMKRGTVLENPIVVKELTKDGSQITDWRKLSTQSIELPSGQRVQVHFYQNRFTEEINYTLPDFKVKNPVDVFKGVESPQSVLDQYGFKF